MPPGFTRGQEYAVLSGFFPNGSRDLHLHVIGNEGAIAPLLATEVKMISAEIIDRCVVLPVKSGPELRMPPGFQTNNLYRVLASFLPNGSSDLHFFLINESGIITPMLAKGLKFVRDNQRIFHFDTARVWKTLVRDFHHGWAETCLDLLGRKMLPHRVTWDGTFENITIEWTRPVAGHLLLG